MKPSAALAEPRYVLGGYREFCAPPSLTAFSESIWLYRTPSAAALGGATHRVLPDPALSLAFRCRRSPDGSLSDPALIIIGPKTRPHLCTFEPDLEIVAVRLKLEWIGTLLGLAFHEHSDAEDDLPLALPEMGRPLFHRLVETRSAGEAATILAAALLRRQGRQASKRPEVAAYALDLIRRTQGRATVEQIAAATGLSVRHLRRTVRREGGISLKGYARVVRFLQAMTTADRAADPSWARIAADSGFCDQSHLIRESRALCGLAPSHVARERRAEAEMSNRR
jgi:AraC-like DNA-binding protein